MAKSERKQYEDQNGNRQKLDPNDPETQRRVATGELREVADQDQSQNV